MGVRAEMGEMEGGKRPGGRARWSGTNKNRDVSTGPLARPFAYSLAPLTRWLAPNCLLRGLPSAALTCSLACSLRSLPRSWESEFLTSQTDLVLYHGAVVPAWMRRVKKMMMMMMIKVRVNTWWQSSETSSGTS